MARRTEQDAPDHLDLDAMVAVASGTVARVSRWSELLAGAGVPCVVARPCGQEDFAELWVDGAAADDARAVLCHRGRWKWDIW